MEERESIFTRIRVALLTAITGSFLNVGTQLKYNQVFGFTDPQSVPDLATVMALVGGGAGIPFTETDLVEDGSGGAYLPFILAAGQIILPVRIDYAGSSEQFTPGYDFATGNITGFSNPNFPGALPSMDITIYTFGKYVAPTPTPPAPVFSLQPSTPLTIIEGNTLTLSAAASDTINYQWYKNGVAISGETSNVYTKTLFGATDAGTYKVIAIGIGGSTESDNSVVSYDMGVIIQNLTSLLTDYSSAANPSVTIDIDYGSGTATLFNGQSVRIPTATTSIDIVQSGPNSLPFWDGIDFVYFPITASPNVNTYAKPIGGFVSQLRIFNNA